MHRVAVLSNQCASAGKKEPYGGQNAAKVISLAGVDTIFTLTGGHIAPILVGCAEAGIRVIDVRDEATAVFAADAYSRITGKVGVAVVTAGPGLTNTITAVKNAQLAESAVLVMAGATSTLLKGRGSLQDIDQLLLMKHHVKWSSSIRYVKDIVPTMRQAFLNAREGVPGPVFVEFPLDTIWPYSNIQGTILKSEKGPSVKTLKDIPVWIQHKYLERYLSTLFKDAFTNMDNSPLMLVPRRQPVPVAEQVCKALLKSSKPVFLLGSQIARSDAHDIALLVGALEKLAVPVYLSGMARGLLGKSHSLHMKHNRGRALAQADFICFAGVPADFRVDYGRQVNRGAKFIMVNQSGEALKKNSDLRGRDFAIHAEPFDFVVQLGEFFEKLSNGDKWGSWRLKMRESDEKRDQQINKMASSRDFALPGADVSKYVNPVLLCKEIDAVMDDDSIIVADGGDFVGTASYIVRPRKPVSWLDPGVFGTLGVGGGFAIAAKACRPKSEVWVLFGDGACGWSLAEIDTMVRMKLPVIIVVGNDACWMQMHRDQVRLLDNAVATNLRYTRYDEVAKGFGAEGLLLDSDKDIKQVLAKAKEIAKGGTPVLINAMIFKSNFRQGSISL
jgi:acetolactate synthase-like protein